MTGCVSQDYDGEWESGLWQGGVSQDYDRVDVSQDYDKWVDDIIMVGETIEFI